MIKKPMLAVACKDIESLAFPVLATPKLDGIRCLVVDGQALSRKFLPIPNHYVRRTIEAACPNGFDGEIMCPGKTFNETQSLIMSEEGEPDFNYWVFDYVQYDIRDPYSARVEDLREWMTPARDMSKIVCLLPVKLHDLDSLKQYEIQSVLDGYEGIMVRDSDSPYKGGRSTLKEGYLLKIKRFEDSEAEVLGFEERMKNNNTLQADELGHAKRSSHKEGLEPSGTLGSLLVRDVVTGIEFSIGTGFDDVTRKEIWDNRDAYLGRLATYRYQPAGMKEKPRFPSFKGFRDPRDL